MQRLTLILAALAFVAFGCGTTPTSVAINTLVPAPGELSGWSEDTESKAAGVQVGRTDAEIEALIDGAGAPFMPIANHSITAFAWQKYKNTTSANEVWVWQCTDSAKAKALFDYLMTQPAWSGNTWNSEAVGDEGRIADTGATMRVNFHKGPYYVESRLTKGTATDEVSKADVESFAKAIATKIP